MESRIVLLYILIAMDHKGPPFSNSLQKIGIRFSSFTNIYFIGSTF